MAFTVKDLIFLLDFYFPLESSAFEAIFFIFVIFKLYPLWMFHILQSHSAIRCLPNTAWKKSINMVFQMITTSLDGLFPNSTRLTNPGEYTTRIYDDIEMVYDFIGLPNFEEASFPIPFPILLTTFQHCIICANITSGLSPVLRRFTKPKIAHVIGKDNILRETSLVVAECPNKMCKAAYYPDHITFKSPEGGRRCQRLICNAQYLRVSKHPSLWVHQSIAYMQEQATINLGSGWSNFANFYNAVYGPKLLTVRQSTRLFIEHFSRRLLIASNIEDTFTISYDPNSEALMRAIVNAIGKNGGTVSGALDHCCTDCTHPKRFRSDLINEGISLSNNPFEVAEADILGADHEFFTNGMDIPIQNQFSAQLAPPPGEPRGYIRTAITDGKTLGHRKCAVDLCENGLTNYRNGRFCETHFELSKKCGIVTCGRPVQQGKVTCSQVSHVAFYEAWIRRFGRENYHVIHKKFTRRANARQEEVNEPHLSTIALPAIDGVPGDSVIHNFKAKKVHCVQTFQWACGIPIAWGKCYVSESLPRVYELLGDIWKEEDNRPSFLFYDDACNLVRYLEASHPNSPWLHSTRFIVDAFHYITHRSTDIVCRVWCNPSPTDGSQPDLLIGEQEESGDVTLRRSFNSSTAEQLNAWLTRFEGQTRQMSDTSFDFFMHTLMLIYKEDKEKSIKRHGKDLLASDVF